MSSAASTESAESSFSPVPGLPGEALALLRDLIRNACENDLTSDSGHEERSAATIERFFADAPVRIEKLAPRPQRTSIVVTLEGTDPSAEPLTLLGHLDVVPADRDRWEHDPFDAEIEDGAVWGRGAVDMLFITASMAAVVRAIARSGLRPRGTLAFVGVADEEARGGLGGRWLAEAHPEVFSWKNTLSETGGSHLPVRDGSDAIVVNVGEKGAAQRRLTVAGDAGHGSLPFRRDSAIAKIGLAAERIAAYRADVSQADLWSRFVGAFRFDAETEATLRTTAPDGAYEAFGDLARYAHAISHLTVAETVLRAGGPINVLPSRASLELDIRTLPGQSDDDVDAVLRAALGDLADEVRIERLISEPATESPTDSALYEAIEEVIGSFFPDATVVPVLASGGSDLRFGRRLGGVGYGFALHARERTLAEVNAQLHAHDEHVYLDDLALTVTAYDRLVRRFLGL